MGKKKPGNYVGYGIPRFPTRRELMDFADICEHEGLHKACPDCTEKIEQFIEIVTPMVADRASLAVTSDRIL